MPVIFRIITFSTFWFSLKILHTREWAFSLGCRWTISFPHAHASDIPPPRALGFFLAVHTHTHALAHTHMHPCKRTHSQSFAFLSHSHKRLFTLCYTQILPTSLSLTHTLPFAQVHFFSWTISDTYPRILFLIFFLSFVATALRALSLSQHPNSFLLLASHPPLLPSIPSESCFLNQTFKERWK